ncbi:MAG: glycolate oxidase FAD binding [Beijerinckiaceae bacterium]|nr:MAG: glycolate oxidase FAD binding [Beijerinckiaceae bacterium]
MTDIKRPNDEAEVSALVRDAAANGTSLRIQGGGTRAGLGRPTQDAATLSTAGLSGITLYEPAEMVIGAKAGTPLETIEKALAEKGQMLAFEPADFRLLFGTQGTPTIGAVAAGNISGPRRLWGGAARDSLIGVRFVNGNGEIIKSGGRVMKNVTGLDLVKLQAGAWGTLGVLTEVIFKVVPKSDTVATFVLSGLDDATAVTAMATAITSPFEITGAAHLPATAKSSEVAPGSREDFAAARNGIGGEGARTYLRIEGFPVSVDYRAGELAKLLSRFGTLSRLEESIGTSVWSAIRDAAPLAEPRDAAIWRLSVKPSEAPATIEAIRPAMAVRAFYDWGGGLIWLAVSAEGDAGATVIRAAAKAAKGYATLMRAPDAVRAVVPVFEPESAAVAALTRRIKASVDPARLINPGLMHAGV